MQRTICYALKRLYILKKRNNYEMAINPDGKIVASGGDDGRVKLWDVKNKTQTGELSGQNKPVMSVSFSPDGKLLASGSKDYTVKI
ncbi:MULTISPECIES: WD40 repeat domain-containing protein [Spirulina]|uniref:WD40 repeat domain-containing protein n=1 Tax=Spirulina TaxID=1154 RepID=UPI00232DB334|nr:MULTISPECIES: hypothetical protein [Spirulina]